MKEHADTKTGTCRCGKVQFEATAPAMLTMACHCKGCQRMTGSAFSLSVLYSADHFQLAQGEPVIGGMKAFPAHYVCAECSSWVFTRIVTPTGELVNVRTSMFDESDNAPPYIETCTAEKLDWVQVGAVYSFDGFPPSDRFGALIGEFMEKSK